MNFEKKLKRIDHRNWETIRGEWFQYLPNIQIPGQAPDFEISEIIGLDDIILKIPDDGEYKFELLGLREAIFHEGIYLLHKAMHVLGSAEVHINNGILSWSLSSGYHSAFFAVRAIICFLGISIAEVNDKMILIDIWPEPEKLSKTKMKKGYTPKAETKFLRMPRLQHFHIWEIFQRILRVLTIDIWEQNFINFLITLKPKEFAWQRNTLHYKNNKWMFNDLHNPINNPSFSVRKNLIEDIETIDPTSDDFSVILGYLLSNFGYLLLKDIASNVPIISGEFELIKNTLTQSSYTRFISTLPIN